jgi:hypothetical protein
MYSSSQSLLLPLILIDLTERLQKKKGYVPQKTEDLKVKKI